MVLSPNGNVAKLSCLPMCMCVQVQSVEVVIALIGAGRADCVSDHTFRPGGKFSEALRGLREDLNIAYGSGKKCSVLRIVPTQCQ